MKVLLRAPLLTNSGYGVHSRQIFEWLYEKFGNNLDVECLNWGQTPWIIDRKREHGTIAKIMDCAKQLTAPYDVTFQVQLPDEWDVNLGKVNVGVSAFVETDRCSQDWVERCNKMDLVITPSTFTKNVVKRSGILMSKIVVVPEWFNHSLLDTDKCAKISSDNNHYNFSTDFNYLIIAQLTAQDPDQDRKNLSNTLAWLFDYHKNDENVGIVLKTNLGRGTTLDKKHTSAYVKSLAQRFRKGPGPKLHLIHGNMSSEEVASLYHLDTVKAYVSATRGEGYGLPLIDAAVAGLPVIATNWSGHLEFLKKGMFIPVDYEMTQISNKKVDKRIFHEGFRWAEPKKESFMSGIDNLTKNLKDHQENAKTLSDLTVENFHKEKIKSKYDKIFEDLLRKI